MLKLGDSIDYTILSTLNLFNIFNNRNFFKRKKKKDKAKLIFRELVKF